MKKLFVLLLSIPLLSLAQDCKIKKEVDPYTKEIKFTTGFMPLGAGNTLVSIEASKLDIDFLLSFSTTGEARCFDDASTASVLFEGSKSKLNLKNSGSMNCEGLFHFTFRNTPSTATNLQRLSTFKISTIKITDTNNKVTDLLLKDEQKLQLMNAAACIIKEAHTLIKNP